MKKKENNLNSIELLQVWSRIFRQEIFDIVIIAEKKRIFEKLEEITMYKRPEYWAK